jgi:hypothetical protein
MLFQKSSPIRAERADRHSRSHGAICILYIYGELDFRFDVTVELQHLHNNFRL